MTNSATNVTSSPSGYQSLDIRASASEARALALAAWRTGFEDLALPSFGHDATLAAMSGVVPVCASLSLSSAQLRSTSSARASVRFAGGFLLTPQPPSAALSSAVHHSLPLAAEQSTAPVFTPRFAATRQRCRKSERTPNHALQRTAPCVTAPASAAAFPPTVQVPRRTPRSLSLGSLGDLPHVP